jgi:ceramide glucosyltransferase
MFRIIAEILMIFSLGGLLYNFSATLLMILKRRRFRKDIADLSIYPPVTILKPLKGIDEQLESNLESFFRLRYPNYEIIFGVESITDPAIEVVRRLQNKYQLIKTELVIDDTKIGLNPKVNNLNNMYNKASHDLIVINDSNVRVNEFYLHDMVKNISRPGVGLATSTVRGLGSSCIGSILENLHLNTFIAGTTIFINDLIGIPISIGKSMILSRTTLDKIGGFRAFSDYLLEDELLGKKIKELGLRNFVSFHCVDNCNNNWSVANFINRHLRWATMRRHYKFIHYIFEPLSNPVFMAAIALAIWPSITTALLISSIVLLKMAVEFLASSIIRSDLRLYHFLLSPVKDIIIGILWMIAFLYATVKWRGNRYFISKNTKLIAVVNRGYYRRNYGLLSFFLNFNPNLVRIVKLKPKIKSLLND